MKMIGISLRSTAIHLQIETVQVRRVTSGTAQLSKDQRQIGISAPTRKSGAILRSGSAAQRFSTEMSSSTTNTTKTFGTDDDRSVAIVELSLCPWAQGQQGSFSPPRSAASSASRSAVSLMPFDQHHGLAIRRGQFRPPRAVMKTIGIPAPAPVHARSGLPVPGT